MSHHDAFFRVYYEDTDAAGVVYHANYLRFAERARTDWLRQLGYEQNQLMKDYGMIFPVFKLDIRYLKPAVLDDYLHIHTKLLELKHVTMRFEQLICCRHEILAKIDVQIACCDLRKKPIRWPKEFYNKMVLILK